MDFALAQQMAILPTPSSTENMMKPPKDSEEQLEELEAKGDRNKEKTPKFGIAWLENHWPNNIVPYVIDAAFSTSERAIIAQGIQHIHDNSCVRFVARNGEYDYLDIWNGTGGCYAIIPYRTGQGRHQIGLEQTGFVTMKVVVHELLHSLGIKHEQSRPDRDSYITMVWSNINANGGGQFFRDIWKGDSSPPARCTEQNIAGTDYSNCYSGWQVEACGVPGDAGHQGYDYYSIMHYRLNSFAINASENVMIPTDPAITYTGNTELSAMNKTKLQCMYNCDGTSYSGCGGHQTGDSGSLDAGDDDSCDWLIIVEDGFAIEITVTEFDVDCSGKLQIYNGEDDSGVPMEYCNDNPATLVTSADNKLYIKWIRKSPADKFIANWNKVTIFCCTTVRVESSEIPANMWPFNSILQKQFINTNEESINNRFIYKYEKYWLAVKNVTGNIIPSWIGSTTDFAQPGSGLGFMTGSSSAPKCPTAVTDWAYYHQDNKTWVYDPTLKVICDISCSQNPPTAPTNSSSDWDGATKSVGTVVTYTCASSGEKRFARCREDGNWSPASIPACNSGTDNGSENTTTTVTTPAITTTPIQDCWKDQTIPRLSVFEKIRRVATLEEWIEGCQQNPMCEFYRWRNHERKKKRFCQLMKIDYKPVTSMDISGPINCNCDLEPK